MNPFPTSKRYHNERESTAFPRCYRWHVSQSTIPSSFSPCSSSTFCTSTSSSSLTPATIAYLTAYSLTDASLSFAKILLILAENGNRFCLKRWRVPRIRARGFNSGKRNIEFLSPRLLYQLSIASRRRSLYRASVDRNGAMSDAEM